MGSDDSTYVHGIHVVHDGPREAPPLVLVHGSGAAGSPWDPVVPVLARRHHVVRVDLPGHGRSPPAASYDVPGQSATLAAALDELALTSVTVAGQAAPPHGDRLTAPPAPPPPSCPAARRPAGASG